MSIHKIALVFVVAANCGVDIETCEDRVIELVPARCRLGSRGGGRFRRLRHHPPVHRAILIRGVVSISIRHVARLADIVDVLHDVIDLVPLLLVHLV